MIKDIYGKPTVNLTLKDEILEAFLLKSGKRQGRPPLPFLVNTVLEVLDREEKKRKQSSPKVKWKKQEYNCRQPDLIYKKIHTHTQDY